MSGDRGGHAWRTDLLPFLVLFRRGRGHARPRPARPRQHRRRRLHLFDRNLRLYRVPHRSGAGAVRALHEPDGGPLLDGTETGSRPVRASTETGKRASASPTPSGAWSAPARTSCAAATLNTVFAPGIVLRREGRPEVSGREAVATEWKRLFARYRGTCFFLLHHLRAGGGSRGNERRRLLCDLQRGRRPSLVNAPLTARFVRDRNGRFRVDRVTLGAFERQPPEPKS